ncbi:MAG: TonB-dependent receptor [Deltaproteobacteria bacterium]|nr:TonB-dependent receptor [Deltaproteobacteria bacterium]
MYRVALASLLLALLGPTWAAAEEPEVSEQPPAADAPDEPAAAELPDEPGSTEVSDQPVPSTPVRVPSPPPGVLDAPEPAYPQEALEAAIEGGVVLEFGLTSDGVVTDIEVLRSPSEALATAAKAALQDTFFEDPPEGPVPHELRRYFRLTRFVLPEAHRPPPPEPDPDAPEPEMADELTKLPVLSSQVGAQYPAEAKELVIEGLVNLELDVSDTGELEGVRLVEEEPTGWGFGYQAIRAVWQFSFEPAYAGEVPVPVRITYTYGFELEEVVVESAPDTPDVGEGIDPDGPVNFTGIVRERGTRRTLGGVDVYIDNLDHGALTDDFGAFTFRGIPAGLHRVIVAVPGFEKFETEEEIVLGEATDVVYFLKESPLGVGETIVRVKRQEKEVARRSISIETIERIPGTFGDPVKVVQNLPGVARSPFDFGLLIVRGSGPEDSGVHIDGIRVPQLFHFGGLRSIVTPILLEGVDFYPGGYGGTYGRLTGGVLDVRTRTTYEPEIHGMVQADLIDASAAVIGPIKKKGEKYPIGGFVLAARRSYLDIVLPALIPNTIDASQFVFPQWTDIQGKITLRPTPKDSLSLLAYYSQDRVATRLDDPGAASQRASQGEFSLKNDFWRVNFDWTARPGPKVENRLLFAVGQDDARVGVGQFGRLSTRAWWIMLRDHLTLQVDDKLELFFGTDIIASPFSFDFEFFSLNFSDDPNAEPEEYQFEETNFGIGPGFFAEARVKLLDERIRMTPALRVDGYAVPGQFSSGWLDPRFSFQISPDPGKRIDLKGSVGIYHQNPQPFEILDVTGNPDLKPEESYQFSFGTELRFTDFFSLDVQGFYKRLDKLVVFTTNGAQDGGSDSAWNNGGDGQIWGVEAFLRLQEWKNLEGWVSFTYQRSRRRDRPDWDYYWFDFDQPIILDVVLSYGLPFGFRIGGRWRYVSGNPDTPITNAIYDSDSDSYIPLQGPYNSSRLPSFHALDIRIDKDINFRRWKLTFYLDIQNVYNRKNPESVVYNFDYTEKIFLYSLPILPNIGFKAQF